MLFAAAYTMGSSHCLIDSLIPFKRLKQDSFTSINAANLQVAFGELTWQLKFPCSIGDTSSKSSFSIAMLVY